MLTCTYLYLQTREALLAILKDLDEEDHFAIIQFDSNIDSWKESLTKATKENVAAGMDYARNIRESGS